MEPQARGDRARLMLTYRIPGGTGWSRQPPGVS